MASQLVDTDYVLDLELTRGRMDGSLIKSKARMLLDEFGMPTMARILQNPQAPASLQLDVIKQLTEIGDMKPKATAQPVAGSGFTLNISLPAGALPTPGAFNPLAPKQDAPTITLEFNPQAAVQDDLADKAFDLPPMPECLRIPDFKLTSDLVGPPLPTGATS